MNLHTRNEGFTCEHAVRLSSRRKMQKCLPNLRGKLLSSYSHPSSKWNKLKPVSVIRAECGTNLCSHRRKVSFIHTRHQLCPIHLSSGGKWIKSQDSESTGRKALDAAGVGPYGGQREKPADKGDGTRLTAEAERLGRHRLPDHCHPDEGSLL